MHIGMAVDQLQKRVPGITTTEITAAVCQFAARCGEIVDPCNPAGGLAFAIDSFMEKIIEIGDRTGVKPDNVLEIHKKRDGN